MRLLRAPCRWHSRRRACFMLPRPIVFFTILLFSSCAFADQKETVENLQIIKADGERLHYHIELADTDYSRRKGLMHRRSLAPDHGMLLAYPKPEMVAIWMKNTHIPLDIIYINRRGEITQINTAAIPHDLTALPSHTPTLAVLELNAGEVERQDIKVGDKVIHPIFAD